MKQNMRVKEKINIIFLINTLLILFYLVYILLIFPKMTAGILTYMPRRPLFLVLIKSIYAIILLLSMIILWKKKTNTFWLLTNLSSIGILCLWFLCHAFFASLIDMFLLEFIAISFLAITNSKYFIATYNIQRTFRRMTLVYLIPMSIFIACATKFLYFTPIF